jgi:hypothetical protein
MRKNLLRIAAFLVLFTCAGHTYGTFAPIPADQPEMIKIVEQMKVVMIPMPMGTPKSYMQILDGNNLSVSLYLFVTGLIFLALSRQAPGGADNVVLAITSTGMAAVAILSAVYFFPLPAICTGIAALAGFWALRNA